MGIEGEEKVKIKLSFLTEATAIKEMVDFSIWAVSLLLSYGAWWWNPFLLFPLLSFPLPSMILFSRGFYIYIRNEIQFPELEIFCYFFFFNSSIKQFSLFSLESYATVGLIFIYLAYFFPTDCRISTFYIKKERSEPWNEPQAWELTFCRKYLAQGIML